MSSLGDFRVPLTIHLDGHTFRSIQAAAQRASKVAGREVPMRELIERRLAEAVSDVKLPREPRPPRLNNGREGHASRLSEHGQEQIRTMTAEGRSAAYIAKQIGCHRQTVNNYRRRLREAQQNEETRTA